MLLDAVTRVRHPELYQGDGQRRSFEGWYFKVVDERQEHAVAVIPGVSFSEDGSVSQSFVQVVTRDGRTRFFSYPAAAFRYAVRPPFSISVAGSTFSELGMHLDLRDAEGEVRGHVGFGPWQPWPVTWRAPGIMGWYRYVPRMECYHAVVSMDHSVDGSLSIDGELVDLSGGRGYIEKDWGRSFPSAWVWAQSNHFARSGISVTCSVARIPWFSGSFTGHVAGVLLDGRLYPFTTWSGAWLAQLESAGGGFCAVIRDRAYELELRATGGAVGQLKAPVLGAMEGHAHETVGGEVWMRLRELRAWRAVSLFEGVGAQAGIEVMDPGHQLHAS